MAAERTLFAGRVRPQALVRLLHLAFWLLTIVLVLRWGYEAMPRYLPKDWSKAHEFDGLVDWKAAKLFLEGRSPFSPDSLKEMHVVGFGHPPTTAFWFIPFAHFEKATAAELIALASWLFLAIHLYVCAKEFRFPAPIALTVLLFGWALTTEGFVMHWHAIQLSEHIAFPLVLSWAYLRRRKDISSGIALGIAATVKLFPGVIMVFLLFARRFRAFFAASALFVAVGAFMTLTFGVDSWKLFLTQQGPMAHDWMGSPRNGSLQGVIMHAFDPLCVGPAYPSARASYLASAAGIVLLVIAGFVSRGNLRRARLSDPRAIDQPLALFTVLAVWVNPWIWEHYWVFLIQPAFVVADGFWSLLRATFRAWLDEHVRTSSLLTTGGIVGVAGLGLAAIARLLGTQDVRTERLIELWFSTHDPWVHRQLHLHEVFNWLPWPLMIALCLLCALVRPRLEKLAKLDEPAELRSAGAS